MESPIFILGCTKSGTSLLRNLLDNHPNLFCIPFETHYFQSSGYWVNYHTRRNRPKKISLKEKRENFLKMVEYMNDYENLLADNFTKGKWDLDRFKKIFFSKNSLDTKEFLNIYFEALYQSLYHKPLSKKKRVVEKSVDNAEFALEWRQIYPNSQFIHIIRNPYSNIVSFRKFKTIDKNFPLVKSIVYSMYNSFYFLYKNQRLLDNYKVILYEDLIKDPIIIMKDISQFLNIEFTKHLTHPSILGEPWEGNSTNNLKFKGVSNINLDKWKKQITNFEINIVNELFDHVLERFDYDKLTPKKGFYHPAKNEKLINYMLNRAFWKLMPRF
jgi:hypothetical protein